MVKRVFAEVFRLILLREDPLGVKKVFGSLGDLKTEFVM